MSASDFPLPKGDPIPPHASCPGADGYDATLGACFKWLPPDPNGAIGSTLTDPICSDGLVWFGEGFPKKYACVAPPPTTAAPSPEEKKSSTMRYVGLALGALAVLGIGYAVVKGGSSEPERASNPRKAKR